MSSPSPETLFIRACASQHINSEGECTSEVWMPYPQQVLPPLDLADGTLVAFAIIGSWAIGLKARLAFRAARIGVY